MSGEGLADRDVAEVPAHGLATSAFTVGEAPVVVLAAYDAVASAALDASGSLNPPASTSGWEGSEVSTCWQAALEQLGVHEQLGVRRVLMPED